MANQKVIEINSIIKPYSRKMIYKKLLEIEKWQEEDDTKLNRRQQKDLEFYLQAYALERSNDKLKIDKHKFDLNKTV
jgi:hypothetical protein